MIIQLSSILVLVAFAPFAIQETLDFGKLDQYNGQLENPPSLTGSTVWISGSDSDGYDVALSPDIRSKVQGVLDGCGDTLDDKCYQDVTQVLKESELQIDNQLDCRHFGHMLSKTFRIGVPKVGMDLGIVALYAYIADLLLSMWHIRHSDEEFAKSLFLPHGQVSSVTVIATATTVVISAEAQPIATITPVLDMATLMGSKAPSVTAVSTAHGAFSTGDLSAILDANLASRLDEVMHRMTECTDGRDFEDGTSLRRRAGTGYAASDKKQPVQFKIYWKEGCLLDPPGGDEIFPNNPLALKDAEKNTCQNLLIDNYKKCNNLGVGGSIQAGCLVYEFKAEHD